MRSALTGYCGHWSARPWAGFVSQPFRLNSLGCKEFQMHGEASTRLHTQCYLLSLPSFHFCIIPVVGILRENVANTPAVTGCLTSSLPNNFGYYRVAAAPARRVERPLR